jgi:DNA-binding MarR family transcriptional regulator
LADNIRDFACLKSMPNNVWPGIECHTKSDGRFGELRNDTQTPVADSTTRASFGHNLRQANRLCQRYLGTRVSRLGITIGQWYALRALWEKDHLTQIELADAAGIAGPAMVAAVRALLAQGLVSRSRPKDDKRKYIISLTENGKALKAEGLRASIESNAKALEGVSAEDARIALEVLRTVLVNLSETLVDASDSSEVDLLIGP